MLNQRITSWRVRLSLLVALATLTLLVGCDHEMRNWINCARDGAGLRLLTRCDSEADLAGTAFNWAMLLRDEGEAAHLPEASKLPRNPKYRCFGAVATRHTSEEIAAGEKKILDGLLAAEGTRSIILSPKYRWVGTAFEDGLDRQGKRQAYAVLIFAGDESTCANALASPEEASVAALTSADGAAVSMEMAAPAPVTLTEMAVASPPQAELLRHLSPRELELGLRSSAARNQAFGYLATGDFSARAPTPEQLARAEALLQQLAEQHPELREELLKAWSEFKRPARSGPGGNPTIKSATCRSCP